MQFKKVIALYVRLSIEDKDVKRNDAISESRSIKNQRALLQAFIKQHPEFEGYEIVEYRDDGYSGTNFERPKFIELMSEVRKGAVAVILVKDFSRLGRDYLESGNFLDRIFPAYGVRFISVNDHYDSNSHIGQTTDIDVGFKNIVNDMYSKDISVKKKSVMKTRYEKGEFIFAYSFYGYVKNPEDTTKLIVDEVAAEVVRRIFYYCIDGYSTQAIAELLNEEGIPSPYEHKRQQGITMNTNLLGKKSLWDKAKIRDIIKDERYLGKMVSNKMESTHVGSKVAKPVPRERWIIVENTHEAIIQQVIFDLANQALSSRAKSKGRIGKMKARSNLFTCPYCHHKLQFCGGKDNRKYLFCSYGTVNGDERCKNLHIETAKVEQVVLQTVNAICSLYNEVSIKKIKESVDSTKEMKNKQYRLNSKLSTLKVDKRNAYMKYTEGTLTREDYMQHSKKVMDQIFELEYEIELLGKKIAEAEESKQGKAEMSKELDKITELVQYDGEVISEVLDAIYVDETYGVEVVFKRHDILEQVGIA